MTTITFPQRGYTSSQNINMAIGQFKGWIELQCPTVLEYFDVCYTEKTVYLKSKRFHSYTISKIDGYNPEKAIVLRCKTEYQLDSNMVAKLVNLVSLDNELASKENIRQDLGQRVKAALRDLNLMLPNFNFEYNAAYKHIIVWFKYAKLTFYRDSNKHTPKAKVNSYKQLNGMTVADLVAFTEEAESNAYMLETNVLEIIKAIPVDFWK